MQEIGTLKPRDLIATARDLIVVTGRRKPRQSNLHRATSTAYYAMFHTLARSAADLMIGGTKASRSAGAWKQAYRALDHGTIKSACGRSDALAKFPKAIQDFANTFVALQEKRHTADYDPDARALKSEVALDIALAARAITDFEATPAKDRRAFAAFIIFKTRKF
ncbi:MAG: hypothetical protein HC871_05300 [Rhizobiales bacterium]|nr:hypothetical protein [Hyphomicrobiales bacterium]